MQLEDCEFEFFNDKLNFYEVSYMTQTHESTRLMNILWCFKYIFDIHISKNSREPKCHQKCMSLQKYLYTSI